MKVGYRCVHEMCDELAAFMERHKFRALADFKGHSLQYFTTHYDLVHRQAEARKAAARPPPRKDGKVDRGRPRMARRRFREANRRPGPWVCANHAMRVLV